MNTGRRQIVAGLLASLATARVTAGTPGRVIVVGAGFAGATCARYLKRLAPRLDVLLIDARATFMTGPFSNLVIAGLRSPRSITRQTARIAAAHGVRYLQEAVSGIDPVALAVSTASGRTLRADWLVVAPGVAMRWDLIEGLDARTSGAAPHAWLGDEQVLRLRERLRAVPDGGTVLIAAPPNPYRCPPGPYERASLVAHALLSSGRRRCKILIADAKDDFTQSALFKYEWDVLYPGMIEWRARAAGGEVVRVDTARGRIWLRDAVAPETAALLSAIPAQRAADIAQIADLTDDTGWCPIDPNSFESRRHARVHVIGDACIAAPMPKSGFAANSQAKVCASAIAAAVAGAPAPEARLLNTCYSLVAADAAISVSAYYGAVDGKLAVLSAGESPLAAGDALRAREGRQAQAWYRSITADSFGPG